MSFRYFIAQVTFIVVVVTAGLGVYFFGLQELFGSSSFKHVKSKPETVWPVQATVLTRADYELNNTLFGRLIARRRPELSFRINGCVETIRHDLVAGARVSEGEVLAELKTDALLVELAGAQNRLNEHRAAITELGTKLSGLENIALGAKRTVELSSKALARTAQLIKSGSVSSAQLEKAQNVENDARMDHMRVLNERSALKAAIETQNARIAVLENAERKALLSLSWATLTSPIDGIIESSTLNKANCILASQPVVTLVDPRSIEAEFEMPSFLYDKARARGSLVGRRVNGFYALGDASASFGIEITHVGPVLDKTRRMVRITGRLLDRTSNEGRIVGRNIQVQFPVQEISDVYKLSKNVVVDSEKIFAVRDARLVEFPIEIMAIHNNDIYFRAELPGELPILTTQLGIAMAGLKVRVVNDLAGKE